MPYHISPRTMTSTLLKWCFAKILRRFKQKTSEGSQSFAVNKNVFSLNPKIPKHLVLPSFSCWFKLVILRQEFFWRGWKVISLWFQYVWKKRLLNQFQQCLEDVSLGNIFRNLFFHSKGCFQLLYHWHVCLVWLPAIFNPPKLDDYWANLQNKRKPQQIHRLKDTFSFPIASLQGLREISKAWSSPLKREFPDISISGPSF